jgi:hypothetical protein
MATYPNVYCCCSCAITQRTKLLPMSFPVNGPIVSLEDGRPYPWRIDTGEFMRGVDCETGLFRERDGGERMQERLFRSYRLLHS